MALTPLLNQRKSKPSKPSRAAAIATFGTRANGLPDSDLGSWFGIALAGSLYLALALAVTWPFVLHPASTLVGVSGSDLTSNIAYYGELANAHLLPFLPGVNHAINAPMGLATEWNMNLVSVSSTTTLWLLSTIFGAITADGLLAVGNFVSCAMSMFLLVRWLTKRWGAAVIAGIAFGFWPYLYATAPLPFGDGWLFVLILWRGIVAAQRPSVRNGLLLGLATALCMTWLPYWLLLGSAFWASIVVASLCIGLARGQLRQHVHTHIGGLVIVLAVLAAAYFVGVASNFEYVPTRSAGDFTKYSARPLLYLTPSAYQLVLGRWTRPFLAAHFNQSSTAALQPIYVGITTLLLALLGLVGMLIRWRRERPTVLDSNVVIACCLGGLGALVALVWSGPPEVNVLGVLIPLPSHFVETVTSVFRTGAYFAVIVMVGVALFAGVGVDVLISHRGTWVRGTIVLLLAAVVFIDLTNFQPSSRPHAVPKYSLDSALERQPRGILAEYPLVPQSGEGSEVIFRQLLHKYPIFNGYHADSDSESMKLELASLTEPGIVSKLARIGVRYVIVRAGSATAALPPQNGKLPGLQQLAADSYGTLYRVTASPARQTVYAVHNFSYPEGPPGSSYRWMTSTWGTIVVEADCDVCEGTLRFGIGTYRIPRTLTITYPNGRVILQRTVASCCERAIIPLRFQRKVVLTLRVQPPPQSPAQFGSADTRMLSVLISQPISFVSRHLSTAARERHPKALGSKSRH